jgi:hypothetical protein
MAEFPAIGDLAYDAAISGINYAERLEDFLAATKQLLGAQPRTEVTLSSGGHITPSRSVHSVDTYMDAASDNLDFISLSLPDGSFLLLVPENTGRVVTVRNTLSAGNGKIQLNNATPHIMDAAHKCILLRRDGATWYEVIRVGAGSEGGISRQVFTASGTFTVPAGVTSVYVTMIGGGGGGAGGAAGKATDSSGNGTVGDQGGDTLFGVHLTSTGGAGGSPGTWEGQGGAAGFNGDIGENMFLLYGGRGGRSLSSVLGNPGKGGQGGKGGDATIGLNAGGGGASGSPSTGPYLRELVSGLTPGANITVTVGAGGAGGAKGTFAGGTDGSDGSSGNSGIVIVEWDWRN